MSHHPSRRTVLASGIAALGVAAGGVAGSVNGVLPGRLTTRRWLGIGDVDRAVPAIAAPAPTYATFTSSARRRDVQWALWTPAEASSTTPLPVVVVLHGRGAGARTAFDALGWHLFAAAAFAAGTTPFALVAVDGGDTYWHPRASGDDPLRMITDELLPRVRDAGLHGPLGVWGWSMGGYAALSLARESAAGILRGPDGPLTIAAAAAASPALFASAADTSPGAFDGPGDFARWGDLVARPGLPAGPPPAVRVTCGVDDPFVGAIRRYVAACRGSLTSTIHAGRHDDGYWRWSAPGHVDFLARTLTS